MKKKVIIHSSQTNIFNIIEDETSTEVPEMITEYCLPYNQSFYNNQVAVQQISENRFIIVFKLENSIRYVSKIDEDNYIEFNPKNFILNAITKNNINGSTKHYLFPGTSDINSFNNKIVKTVVESYSDCKESLDKLFERMEKIALWQL